MSIAASNSIGKLPYVVDRVKAETYNTALMKFFKMRFLNISSTSSPERFSLAFEAGRPTSKAREKCLGDEVDISWLFKSCQRPSSGSLNSCFNFFFQKCPPLSPSLSTVPVTYSNCNLLQLRPADYHKGSAHVKFDVWPGPDHHENHFKLDEVLIVTETSFFW